MNVFIYALCEPITGEVRYVGKAQNPKYRLASHLWEAKWGKRKNHRNDWIKSVMNSGGVPRLEILDEVPEEHWQQWEVAWIEYFQEQGLRLVNSSPGGEHVVFTDEVRKKLGQTRKGRIPWNKGKPAPPGSMEKLWAARRGKPSWNSGLTMTPERIAKQIAARKNNRKEQLESAQRAVESINLRKSKKALDSSIQNCMVSV